jgi:pimeloyl-ACP methyl ester carboxylesterase
MKHILVIIFFAFTVLAFVGEGSAQDVSVSEPPEPVSFSTQDGGLIHANLYGKGERGVVLVHGGRFKKESWDKQARVLVKAGFRVLAIDLRSYGKSTGPGQTDIYTAPLHYDVLAAVRYLHKAGAKTVSVVGGSMGGGAGADAVIEAAPGEIDRLVTLGTLAGEGPPEKLKGRLLVITTRDDANAAGPRLPSIRAAYKKAPKPKKLVILKGSAHAQFMFDTDQGDEVMRRIVRFLSKR